MRYELNFSYVIKKLKEELKINSDTLGYKLGVSIKQINDYILNHDSPRKEVVNIIIQIIENNNLDIYDLLDIPSNEGCLYHGSKTGGIKGVISTHHNSENIDFGNGFYLSDSFKTAITYVISKPNPIIYRFDKEQILKASKVYSFYGNHIDWVLYIGLNRNKINDENDQMFLANIFDKKFKGFDILVGEIADSYNFETMDLFFKNESDIMQVEKALTLANIGPQYVIKNERLANKLEILDEFVIESKLKDYLKQVTRKKKDTLKEQYSMFVSSNKLNSKYTFEKIKEKILNEHE